MLPKNLPALCFGAEAGAGVRFSAGFLPRFALAARLLRSSLSGSGCRAALDAEHYLTTLQA